MINGENEMKRHLQIPTFIFYGIAALMIVIGIICFVKALYWINRPFPGFLLYKEALVGSFKSRDWPGIEAGLKFVERIEAVDGQPVLEGQDVLDAVKDKAPDTPITYLVQSKGQTREVNVPVDIFTVKDFLLVFFIVFLVGSIIYAFGITVYLLKPNMRVSWVFLLASLWLGTYMVSGFEIQSSYSLVRFHYLCLCLIPPALFHLFLIFPDKKRVISRWPALEYLIYVPALLIALGYQINTSMFREAWSSEALWWVPSFTALGRAVRLFMLFCMIGLVTFLFHALYKASTVQARQRARMILLGVAMAFGPPMMIMVLAFLVKFNFPWNFFPFFIVFFPASIAYSIVKHNLFDADAIIKRTVGYVVVTAIVVGAYVGVSVSLNLVLGQYQLAQSQAFPLLFTLGVILIFNPLRDRVQSLVDRIFFRKEYDYGVIVEKVSGAMTSLLDLPQILKHLTQTFIDDMFINTSSVMLLTPEGSEFQVYLADGEKKQDVEKKAFKREDPLLEIIEEEKRELTKYDVLEDPKFREVSKSCAAHFDTLHANLMVPLVYQEKVIGSLNLGEKKSGKPFHREDIELLRTLAHQGAVAIENARMVEEIIEKERLKTKILDAFGKYVTHEVRDQILEGHIPLDGETKEVTVLFADLRDFATLAESTTPKEVVRIINGYFREMADAIGQNHGLVLQFIGDEIEAVFGAPLPLEDHPTHAVRAALAMRERLVVVNERLKQQGYSPLRHGIGIHTGNVVAANIGSEDRLSYALVGDTVNVASRIQGLNKEFSTDLLISATTVARLGDNIAVEKLPATTVKGKKDPVEIYKLS